MKPKFKIGDIVFWRYNPKTQYQILDIVKELEKVVEGDWVDGSKEDLVDPNSYVLKNLETNKLIWTFIWYVDDRYQLFQPVVEKSLKWKNYQEILV